MNLQDFNIQTFGEGYPMIMLHGFYLDQVSMIAACEPLFVDEPIRRIYLDLPGMGMNTFNHNIQNADQMVEVIIEFIQGVLGDQAFSLVGMSYGSYLARGVAHKLQARCLGMFLLAPVVFPKSSQRRLPNHQVVIEDGAYTRGLDAQRLKDLRESNVVITKRVVERQEAEIDGALARANVEFLERYQTLGYETSYDVDSLSQDFDKPMMILAGKQDSVVGFEDQYSLSLKYKTASFMVLHGAGHGLHIDQEEAFNAAFKTWLALLI